MDPNGHGTHVAGIIASSGGQSSTVTNASSPSGPYAGTNTQFRGKAPAANLFVQPVGMMTGPFTAGSTLIWPSDGDLQQGAARTNAFISNNSWNYVGTDSQTYDLHAASYDAAVRDALPTVSGSQPLLMVFSAGNAGGGDDDGTQGVGDQVQSPGTAKNVITVGAIEQLRDITNEVWKCSTVTGTNNCVTNQPWLGLTDSSDQVAAFSSRGNVGIGIEGDRPVQAGRGGPGHLCGFDQVGAVGHQRLLQPDQPYLLRLPTILRSPPTSSGCNRIFVPDNAVQLNLTVGAQHQFAGPVPRPALSMSNSRVCRPTPDGLIARHQPRLPAAGLRLEIRSGSIGITRSATRRTQTVVLRSRYRHRGHQRPGQLPPGAGRAE